MDQNKINEVLLKFFSALKSKDNKMLETGLTQNQTIDALFLVVSNAIESNPEKFIIFVEWFLNSSMYLLDENEELSDLEELLRLAR